MSIRINMVNTMSFILSCNCINYRYWLSKLCELLLYTFSILIISSFFLRAIGFGEPSFRVAGCLLQFIGMIVTIWGLLSVVVKHSRRNYIVNIESTRFNLLTSGVILTYNRPNQLLGQIEEIRDNLNKLEREIQSDLSKIEAELNKHNEYIKNLQRALKEDGNNTEEIIRRMLKSAQKNDLKKSLIGIGFITAGIIMSTMTSELLDVIALIAALITHAYHRLLICI